ncbi:hypothetical protein FHL15_009864 [Xylaria flabelliformis]|uniref:Uncharacterized protein n=1 Tax=Xylaria flabelliformis TaxID=2512241 RepID=A0A553HMW3_9PEZI|nr:hypothetical protein FHL15_009864 [Xylaria flabelliformis]
MPFTDSLPSFKTPSLEAVAVAPNNPSNSRTVTITTTNWNKFISLPSDDFEMLKKAVPPIPVSYTLRNTFQSPALPNFSWWASPVTEVCSALTEAMDKVETEIECAGYIEDDTMLTSYTLLTSFLHGESVRSACGVRWYVTAILISLALLDHGAILTTHDMEDPELDHNCILRSELLTLLALLRVACRRAVRDGKSSTDPTVFVLSFTYGMVRVLEARLTDANKISVSIPKTVKTQVQSVEKRDELFKELVSWTMFKDRNPNRRNPSGLTIRSATSDSSKVNRCQVIWAR